ncbi:3-deoxy-7-phosphoheptulonate synthase [Sphingosinicella humi]|uniref:Phospho-2-dehydro-3-deoxyheptonate aldolase n=1 Tax=Allosphingosinicella humi TaxID=2068657 RepID=A0A2U2J4I5_9SPHN|nr:3-deoxy-7-phosphoheptulonate synthase class II [Sphingosinicella humi]PWG03222.1 3-deoxy-7-phosphoheptulonate synthase class II [Sphingosinicella humi]
MSWSPKSWRNRPAAQMPDYPDPEALGRVEARLAAAPPLTKVADIMHLRAQLARVASGRAFLIQGGDCAESFAEFGSDKVRTTFNLLLKMGAILRAGGYGEVVHLARIAGQFAKPRSSPSETIDGVTLPSYRGDAVNGPAFDEASRIPDPRRLLDAHRQAQVTIDLLKAYAAAAYADLPEINRDVGSNEPARPVSLFTSHEALLLNYEQALTRFDEASERWWALSGHMIWIGDRTRQLDGAHVEFASGIANPIGLKCGPNLEPDALLRLIDRLDPDNRPGRLVLIGRFGAANVGDRLPELMRVTLREGRAAIWSIDPMHGNTRSLGGFKTRLVQDIMAEVSAFFEVAAAENVHPGGVHLEMTGADVTECLGGSVKMSEEDLPRRYLTLCDPRLNRTQALDVASTIARLLRQRRALTRSDAA